MQRPSSAIVVPSFGGREVTYAKVTIDSMPLIADCGRTKSRTKSFVVGLEGLMIIKVPNSRLLILVCFWYRGTLSGPQVSTCMKI